MKFTRKTIAAAVIIVSIVSGFVWYRHMHAGNGGTRYVTGTVTKGTLTVSVSGSGNVVADKSADVSPTISGTVDNLSVHLGDHVAKDQTLFTVTNNSLDVTVGKAYVSYLQSKQQLTNAQAQLATAQANAANATQSVDVAKAQAALDTANQQLTADRASSQVDTTKVAADQSTIATDQIILTQAQTSASANTSVTKAQLTAAQEGVTIAQKNVGNAWADYQNQLASANARTVKAAIDGTITTLNIANGDQIGNGSSSASSNASSASSGAPIVIEDLSTLKASIQINEVDAPNVKPGQNVSMTFDAISGLTLTGKVEKIDTVGTVAQGVVTYGATVDFDSLDSRIRPGMSVSATITTDVKQNVLMVPNSAVKTQSDGSSYVQILKNGTPTNQPIEIGAANDSDTEVTSGLSEGESIVTQVISAQASNSASSSNRNGLNLGGLGGGAFRASGGSGAVFTRQFGG